MERPTRTLVAGFVLLSTGAPPLWAQRPTPEIEFRFEEPEIREHSIEASRGDFRVAAPGDLVRLDGTILRGSDDSPLRSLRLAAEDLPFTKRLTIEAWVAVETTPPRSGLVSFAETDGAETRGFYLGTEEDRFAFGLRSEGSGTMTVLTADTSLRLGVWHHVVGTYDGKRMRLYLDGRLVGSSTAQKGRVAWFDRHRLTLGAVDDARGTHRMDGALSSVRIYDRGFTGQAAVRLRSHQRPALPNRLQRRIAKSPPPPIGDEDYDLETFQGRVDQAIDRGANWLLHTQGEDGSWPQYGPSYRNGPTALAALALVHAGVPEEHPQIQAALDFLRAELPKSTYCSGAQLMLLGSLRNPDHKEWAEKITAQLLSFDRGGEWAYPRGGPDLSNTQFAALGFFGASLLGIEIPSEVWSRASQRTRKAYQGPVENVIDRTPGNRTRTTRSGHGYSYSAGGRPPTFSMTTAGLCVLALADQLGGTPRHLQTTVNESIQRGTAWLGTHFQASGSYYALYGAERVGAFLNESHFGNHDWYREGATSLLGRQAEDGGWNSQVSTSFAVLFLSRATSKQLKGPVTGEAAKAVWTQTEGAVRVRAAGTADGKVAFYLVGFDEELLARAPRIQAVHWAIDGKIVGSEKADAEQAWKSEPFAIRHELSLRKEHRVTCEVEFVDESGQPGRVRSKTLTFGGQPSR